MPHPASLRRKRRPFFAGRKENRSRNGRKTDFPVRMRRSDRRTGRPRKHGKRQNSKGMPYGTIYMLPTPIGDRPVYDVLPDRTVPSWRGSTISSSKTSARPAVS